MSEATEALRPFVKRFDVADPETLSEGRDKIAEMLIKGMANGLRRQRDENAPENNQRWEARVITYVRSCLKFLELPPIMTSDAPKYNGWRCEPDGALQDLAQLHFIVRHPRQPQWDPKAGDAPYIFICIPRIPTKNTIVHLKANKKLWCEGRLSYAVDEKTPRERIKGLTMLEQHKEYSAYKWAASPHTDPSTIDMFAVYPILDRIRHCLIQHEVCMPDDCTTPLTGEDALVEGYVRRARSFDVD